MSLHASTPRPGPRLPQVVIITGPTAVGKTAVGLELAKMLDGEVISADSVQVYRGLDIGSDKLPIHQRQGIPHHLIDIMDPVGQDGQPHDYSAGDFHDHARAAIADIIKRGKVPIVVGGTGFYLRFLTHGKTQGPKATPEATAYVQDQLEKAWGREEERLRAESVKDGKDDDPSPLITAQAKWEVGCKLLDEWGDPESSQRILLERNNYYRLERALALVHMTGKKMSELDSKQPLIDKPRKEKDKENGQDPPGSIGDGAYDFRLFFLHRSRSELYDRIATRCEEMAFIGLLDEASMLIRKGIKAGSSSAARSIGYRQAISLLESLIAQGSRAESSHIEQMIRDIIHATHKLVRSQMTWFRDESSYRWLEMESGVSPNQVGKWISERIAEPNHQGGCGFGSGRLTREEEQALKRYRPNLSRLEDEDEVIGLLNHINSNLL